MGEERRWPQCGVCSDRHKGWWPVEEYGTEEAKPVGPDYRGRVIVIAKCSHGRGFKRGAIREQHATIDVPIWWGNAHLADAIRALVFFKAGEGAPDHGLVTRIT